MDKNKGFSGRRVALILVLLVGLLPTRAQITDDLLLAVDSIVELLVNDTVKTQSPMVQDQKQAVDTTHQRILLFGDSMLDGVGRRFYEYAQENGHYLFTSIWYGSTTHSWARTTELDRLKDKVRPTFVIICLGTNDLGYHDLQARSESVREILRVVGDIPYVWIGPAKLPKLNKDFGVVDMLRETIGDSLYYDSYHERLARFPDNVHPTFAASAVWVDKVVAWMDRPEAPYHIRLDKPTRKYTFKEYETHSPRYKGVRK